MFRQHNRELLRYKDIFIVAIQSNKRRRFFSGQHVAAIYSVRRSTLHDRRAGMTLRCESQAKSSRLMRYKETTLFRYVRKLYTREFSPTLESARGVTD